MCNLALCNYCENCAWWLSAYTQTQTHTHASCLYCYLCLFLRLVVYSVSFDDMFVVQTFRLSSTIFPVVPTVVVIDLHWLLPLKCVDSVAKMFAAICCLFLPLSHNYFWFVSHKFKWLGYKFKLIYFKFRSFRECCSVYADYLMYNVMLQ